MKASELKNKSIEELQGIASNLKGQLFNMNFRSPDQKVKDSSQAGKIKKDIARVLTSIKIKSGK